MTSPRSATPQRSNDAGAKLASKQERRIRLGMAADVQERVSVFLLDQLELTDPVRLHRLVLRRKALSPESLAGHAPHHPPYLVDGVGGPVVLTPAGLRHLPLLKMLGARPRCGRASAPPKTTPPRSCGPCHGRIRRR